MGSDSGVSLDQQLGTQSNQQLLMLVSRQACVILETERIISLD